MNERLDKIERRLDGVERHLDGVEGRLGGVEGRLNDVESRLDRVETHLDGMESRIIKWVVGTAVGLGALFAGIWIPYQLHFDSKNWDTAKAILERSEEDHKRIIRMEIEQEMKAKTPDARKP